MKLPKLNKKGDTLAAVYAIIIIVVLVISGGVLFVVLSFESVGYNTIALKQDVFSKKVSDKVYETGFYNRGPFKDFLKFPRNPQEINFFTTNTEPNRLPLDSRTTDGLLISIEIAFHYQIQKENLRILYGTFAANYEQAFVGQARSTLRDACSMFKAIEFFNNRTTIGEMMQTILDTDLSVMYANVVFFQLREIDLPDEFEEALKQVQVAQQDYEVALHEQQSARIRAETSIIEAQANANITVLEAVADAEAYMIVMQAQADAINVTLAAQSEAYYAMGQQLNLTSTELLALLWIMAIMEHDSSLLIIGENTPQVILEGYVNSTGG